MPTKYDFPPRARGDGCRGLIVNLTWDSDGRPVDITFAEIRSQFRFGNERGALAYTAKVGDGITILDGANGKMQLDEFSTHTWACSGNYYYDIEVKSLEGVVSSPVYGILPLYEDVTK